MSDMKPWKCNRGHILGFIRWSWSGFPQLMVLRQALNMTDDHPAEVDLLGPVSGAMPVRCSICDEVKPWAISVETLMALWETLDDATVYEFNQRLVQASKQMIDLADETKV
jgi:hypothetical protein